MQSYVSNHFTRNTFLRFYCHCNHKIIDYLHRTESEFCQFLLHLVAPQCAPSLSFFFHYVWKILIKIVSSPLKGLQAELRTRKSYLLKTMYDPVYFSCLEAKGFGNLDRFHQSNEKYFEISIMSWDKGGKCVQSFQQNRSRLLQPKIDGNSLGVCQSLYQNTRCFMYGHASRFAQVNFIEIVQKKCYTALEFRRPNFAG